jgi:cell wall-associated NlpC family hydrolase
MAGHGSVVAGSVALPILLGALTILAPFLVLGAAGGAETPPTGAVLCGAGGAQQTVAGITLSAEQMANAQTIVVETASRRLSSYAAVVALTTAYTESTLHNSSVETDHDSEGLFQQRISIYGKAVADDPVLSTNAFLDRLVGVANWQDTPVGVDAQDVQVSAYPDRYATNQPLAVALTGMLWPAASAAADTAPSPGTTDPSSVSLPVVACVGDGANPSEGGHGNVVAGSPTIPTGLMISGSVGAQKAVAYALGQLGKPYLFGAAGPNAFDCSGLTMEAWAAAGIALPHLAAAQVGNGTPEPTDLSQAGSGDLVMIPGSDGTASAPGHVGMIVGRGGDGHLYLIQAPGWQNLPVEITDTTEWIGDIVDVRHIE